MLLETSGLKLGLLTPKETAESMPVERVRLERKSAASKILIQVMYKNLHELIAHEGFYLFEYFLF